MRSKGEVYCAGTECKMQLAFFLCFLGLTIFYFAFELFPDPFGSSWCFALFAGNPIPQASETEQQQKPCKVVHWIVTCKHEIYIAFPQCLHECHFCSVAGCEATSEQGDPKHPASCTVGHHLRTVFSPHPPRHSACCRHIRQEVMMKLFLASAPPPLMSEQHRREAGWCNSSSRPMSAQRRAQASFKVCCLSSSQWSFA